MVTLKELNKKCSNRKVANDFPAQIICRLFGNKELPCKLDKICEPCETKGLWFFYVSIFVFLLICYLVLFWIIKITKISKLLYPLAMLLIIPLEWLITCGAASLKFIRNLPF